MTTSTHGATVRMVVMRSMLGEVLRRLEHHAAIFVVAIEEDGENELALTLRSDCFPSDWEGGEVTPVVGRDAPGFVDWNRA
jgi:hypothetical protein